MEGERIMGTETEYAVFARKRGNPGTNFFYEDSVNADFFSCIPPLLRFVPARIFGTDFYLRNGSRVYLDTGKHAEYAGPPVRGAYAAMQWEKAGDRILEETANRANDAFAKDGSEFRVFKNNADVDENYYGMHENYLMLRSRLPKLPSSGIAWHELLALIGPFLISRMLFAGRGDVLLGKDKRLAYVLSERARAIVSDVGSATTAYRSILNTRDEPHANYNKYVRLHLICGDSLFSEYAIFLRQGVTEMVLDAVEDGFLREPPFGKTEDLYKAMHTLVSDPTLRVAVELNGKTHTIVNILEEYFKILSRFYETSGNATPGRVKALKLFGVFLKKAKKPRPHEHLASYVDWAAKLLLFEKDADARGCPLWGDGNERLPLRSKKQKRGMQAPERYHHYKAMHFQFGENHPRGLARILERRGDLRRMVPESEVQHAVSNPPADTNAHPRVWWMNYLLEHDASPHDIGWSWSLVTYRGRTIFDGSEPYDADPHFREVNI